MEYPCVSWCKEHHTYTAQNPQRCFSELPLNPSSRAPTPISLRPQQTLVSGSWVSLEEMKSLLPLVSEPPHWRVIHACSQCFYQPSTLVLTIHFSNSGSDVCCSRISNAYITYRPLNIHLVELRRPGTLCLSAFEGWWDPSLFMKPGTA